MSIMEEYMELQEKVEQIQKELEKKEKEISEKDAKLLELSEQANELTNKAVKGESETKRFRSMASMLEEDKKELTKERERLIDENSRLSTQLKQFAQKIETNNKTIETKEEMLLSKEQQLLQKDKSIVEKDEKIDELRERISSLADEREKIQIEKIEFMEKMTNEKVELTEKVGELEKQHQEKDQKMKDLRDRYRKAQDQLLGKSMELEKLTNQSGELEEKITQIEELNKKIEELEKQLTEDTSAAATCDEEIDDYKEKIIDLQNQSEVGSVIGAEGAKKTHIGIYTTVEQLIHDFKSHITSVSKTVRIILPNITDIEKYDLMGILEKVPRNTLKNIACAADTIKDSRLIGDLKANGFKITDYRGLKLFALAVDNNQILMGLVDEREDSKIVGVYCDNKELVNLLAQSLMNPFIKGIKI